jgi:hypothetical protein
LVPGALEEQRKAHRELRIGDWKALPLPEESARDRSERLLKTMSATASVPHERFLIKDRLGAPTDRGQAK